MGCGGIEGGVPNPFSCPSSTISTTPGVPILSRESRKVGDFAEGSGGYVNKRCHRAGSRPVTRFLQQTLSCSEGIRKMAPSVGCVSPEHLCEENKIFDGVDEVRSCSHPGRGLVDHSGHERRIFSCPNPPDIKTVSSLCLRRPSVPVQGPLLWPEHGPSGVYEGPSSFGEDGPSGGFPNYPLLRRLAHPGQVPSGDGESSEVYPRPSSQSRNHHQRRKIPTDSDPSWDISRNDH